MNTWNSKPVFRIGKAIGLILGASVLSLNVATAAITVTKHNLSNAGLGTQANSLQSPGTEAICVFCHTPHGADTNAAVPLWNRVLTGLGPYTTYDSLGTSSLDGSVAAVGSVSIACLSCHDGTQAMNVMINTPGSGGYDPAGVTLSGTWVGPASAATPVGSLNYGGTTNIVNIGTDLQNDHPVGVQYAGGGINATTHTTDTQFAGTTNDADFNMPWRVTLNGAPVWYVDTAVGSAGVREKTDMQLYTRNDVPGGGGVDEPTVECASCHNPHTSDNPTFLRIANTGSAVCLACHVK